VDEPVPAACVGPSGRLNHLWRVLATGASFLAFGIGGVLLGLFAFPFLNLAIGDAARRRRMARRLVQRSFHLHIEFMRALGVLTYEVRGRERLAREGLLILANHPTLIDVVFLVSLLPNADCVVKPSLARNPFTRGPVHAAGYIHNDEGAGLVEDCIRAVRRGGNLLIFPEGTRTRRDAPMHLQRGAANIAIRGRLAVTPARLHCAPMTLGKGEKWYRIPLRRFHYIVEIQPDIDKAPFLEPGRGEASAARRLTEFLTQYFSDGNTPCKPSSSNSSS
jgi:1-acyl-sn-glycerol-3-phosphate acyltransferase